MLGPPRPITVGKVNNCKHLEITCVVLVQGVSPIPFWGVTLGPHDFSSLSGGPFGKFGDFIGQLFSFFTDFSKKY